MSIINSQPRIGAAGQSTGFKIERSLRFNSADSAYLSRTPSSAGNRKTWTWSAWLKRSSLSRTADLMLFACRPAGYTLFSLRHANSSAPDSFLFEDANGMVLVTTPKYRDVSAWYHIVLAVDTTQATASNRVKLYVNGSQVTAFSTATYPSQNLDMEINSANAHGIGGYSFNTNEVFDGYLTEINFINAQQLDPSYFGETDTDTGVWKPKAYTGSYGTNGFYLKFADNSGTTSTTLGKDSSGNGNNWTPNNFSVTAGVGNDSLVDTPTPYGTDTGAGGEVRGNYCTLNPLDNGAPSSGLTLANGNLQLTGISSNWRAVRSTVAMSSGKWYCEATVTALSGTLYARVGLATSSAPLDTYLGYTAASWVYINTGNKSTNLSNEAYGASWTTNDVIGIAFDADAGTLTFYKNGVSQGQAFSGLTSGPYFFAVSVYDPQVMYFNFGQRPFAYTAPSGFKALCTQNLPTPTIGATATTRADDYFDTSLYTGNASTLSVTNAGMQPDLVWLKGRDQAFNHYLIDAVRGTNKLLFSSLTDAEYTDSTYLTSFNSNGFTLGAGDSGTNRSGYTYVAWQWKANGAGSSNTSGTITSTVSANTTAGFSIVTATAQSSGVGTFGHGLGVAPSMVIIKGRGSASSWGVYHVSTGNGGYLLLNSTSAFTTDLNFMNNTSPSSTVFTLGASYAGYGTFVTYCFAPVAGYSAFGSYTGNGSTTDGPFVYTGFRPAYVLIKESSTTNSWVIVDKARSPSNDAKLTLFPNLSNSENDGSIRIDLVSNGFKLRNSNNNVNESNQTFIYAAFAEHPFKYSLAR